MLIDEMKKRMFAAMKAGDVIEKEVLRTAIGEVTATGDEPSDERIVAVARKMAKSCSETLALSTQAEEKARLEREIQILSEFLPKTLGVEGIVAALAPVAEQIRGAGNDGQATGIAMKHLKSSGASVEGKDVSAAVKSLRG